MYPLYMSSVMKLKRFFLLSSAIVFLFVSAVHIAARQPVSEAFKNAPSSVLPLLSKNTRLDMLDYFNSGMSTPSRNELGGNALIEQMTDESMTLKMSSASAVQIALLPYGDDAYVALISTVNTPAPDSKLTVYSFDWTEDLTDRVFKLPDMTEWLTNEGKKNAGEVDLMVPFLLVSYSYDPESKSLTLTNNSSSFLSDEIYNMVKPYLHDTLIYTWNGKKFEPRK